MKYLLLTLFLFYFSAYGKADLCLKEQSVLDRADAEYRQAYDNRVLAFAKWTQTISIYKACRDQADASL